MKKILINAFIFARGGSKGVPGKNIRNFNGKPLLAWTLELAKSMQIFDRIVVSTDSTDIAKVALRYGAEVPFMRPAELAMDTSPEWLAWRHAVNSLPPFNIMVSLPATAPLRKPETIQRCIARFQEGDADLVITITPAARHPSFHLVRLDDQGDAHILLPSPHGPIIRRQDASPIYDVTPVCYVTSPAFVLSHDGVFSGHTKAVIVGREESVDIDVPLDFEFAAYLHAKEIDRNTSLIV
jgi:N-acylneuraminate cytidylyltransferase